MDNRRTPLYKPFQRLMWEEMALDPEFFVILDDLSGQMPVGEAWPKEYI